MERITIKEGYSTAIGLPEYPQSGSEQKKNGGSVFFQNRSEKRANIFGSHEREKRGNSPLGSRAP